MKCYLCQSSNQTKLKGIVRDKSDLTILKCENCGLVFLDDSEHICKNFYEDGGMHKSLNVPISSITSDYTDTKKRFELYHKMLMNKKVLDFGCGAGSFLSRVKNAGITSNLAALEINKNFRPKLQEEFDFYSQIEDLPDNSFDVITMFHVLEHLPNPIDILNQLHKKLADNGKIIIEVPSSNDILLNLFDCEEFANFTYWSCHLFLFNARTMQDLLKKTPFKTQCIKQYQRYTLANHLHWIAKGKPAGHIVWSFLDDEILQAQYEKKLAEIGQCDTIVAIVEK